MKKTQAVLLGITILLTSCSLLRENVDSVEVKTLIGDIKVIVRKDIQNFATLEQNSINYRQFKHKTDINDTHKTTVSIQNSVSSEEKQVSKPAVTKQKTLTKPSESGNTKNLITIWQLVDYDKDGNISVQEQESPMYKWIVKYRRLGNLQLGEGTWLDSSLVLNESLRNPNMLESLFLAVIETSKSRTEMWEKLFYNVGKLRCFEKEQRLKVYAIIKPLFLSFMTCKEDEILNLLNAPDLWISFKKNCITQMENQEGILAEKWNLAKIQLDTLSDIELLEIVIRLRVGREENLDSLIYAHNLNSIINKIFDELAKTFEALQ